MTKDQWLKKLHLLAFEDNRLDGIPFACFEPLAEGIANIEAAEQKSVQRPACPECGGATSAKCFDMTCPNYGG